MHGRMRLSTGRFSAHVISPYDRVDGEAALTQVHIDLERALARLSDVSRVVVILYDIEGYTHLTEVVNDF